jgi:hypothetical protein
MTLILTSYKRSMKMRMATWPHKLNEHLTLSFVDKTAEHPAGFWIYDKLLGYNVAMYEPSEESAILVVLKKYIDSSIAYKKRVDELENRLTDMYRSLFPPENDGEDENYW